MRDFNAGTYISQGSYKSFQPTPINRQWVLENMEVQKLLSQADRQLGRLLITLSLVEQNILKRPILYLSDFLERNHSHYYDNLMRVREKNDITQWLKFFLVGVIETAKSGIATFDAILKLQQEVDDLIEPLGRRAENARKVIRALYMRPLTDAERVAKVTDLSMPAAYKLINEMEKIGVLKEITGGQRGRRYLFERYVDLFTPG